MQGANAERWRTLCEQAEIEQDPKRLMELVTEIDDLLRKKEERLLLQQQVKKDSTAA
jgi:hypothetical protein